MDTQKLCRSSRKRTKSRFTKADKIDQVDQDASQAPTIRAHGISKRPDIISIISSPPSPSPPHKRQLVANWRKEEVFYSEKTSKTVKEKPGDSATRRFRKIQGWDVVHTLIEDVDSQRVASARLRENINDLYAEKKELERDVQKLKKDIAIAKMFKTREGIKQMIESEKTRGEELVSKYEAVETDLNLAEAAFSIIEKHAPDFLTENQMLKNRVRLLELEIMDLKGGPRKAGWPRRLGNEWDGVGLTDDEEESEEGDGAYYYANGGS